MSIPNLEHLVHAVRNGQAWDFRTKAGLCAYTDAVVRALHAEDPAFGHLTKSEAQNHCVDAQGRRHAVDVALYRTTGQVVDFVTSAGFGDDPPPNAVSWHEGPEGEYPASSWYAPGGAPNPTPEPPKPQVDNAPLLARVADLERHTEHLRSAFAEVSRQIEVLNRQIAELSARPAPALPPLPDYIGQLGPVTIISRPRT